MKVKQYIDRLGISSEFLKNVAFLFGGNVIAQLFTIGTSPLLTRLFTPENFGLLALVTTTTSIVGSVSTLCYERAIVLPKEDHKAVSILMLSVLILITTSLATFICFLIFGGYIIEYIGGEELKSWLMIVPICFLAAGLLKTFRFWCFRTKQFRLLSLVRNIESFSNGIFKIIAGMLIGSWAGGLILGFAFGLIAALTFMLLRVEKIKNHDFGILFCYQGLKESFVQYKKYPIYATWSTLSAIATRNAIVFILSHFFAIGIVGFYNLANRILAQPIEILSDSFSNVFLQKASFYVANNHEIKGPYLKLIYGLFFLGIVPFFILGVFGKEIFTFLFGDGWSVSGTFVQILSPWLFLVFLNGPSNVIFEILQKQNVKLFFNLAKGVVSTTVLLVTCMMENEVEYVLGWFVGVNIFFEFAILMCSYFLTKQQSFNLIYQSE